MKGTKGEMGDSGLPGEAVNKTDPILYFFRQNNQTARMRICVLDWSS